MDDPEAYGEVDVRFLQPYQAIKVYFCPNCNRDPAGDWPLRRRSVDALTCDVTGTAVLGRPRAPSPNETPLTAVSRDDQPHVNEQSPDAKTTPTQSPRLRHRRSSSSKPD